MNYVPAADPASPRNTKMARFNRTKSGSSSGFRCIEPIVLHDHDGARLPGIVLPARGSPDFAASHSETASMKA